MTVIVSAKNFVGQTGKPLSGAKPRQRWKLLTSKIAKNAFMFVRLLMSLFWWNFRLLPLIRPQKEKQKRVFSWLLDGESDSVSFLHIVHEKRILWSCICRYNSPLGMHLLFSISILDRWGFSRHFHYVPEILAAFFWSVPALFDHVSMSWSCYITWLISHDFINCICFWFTCSFCHTSMCYI